MSGVVRENKAGTKCQLGGACKGLRDIKTGACAGRGGA